MSVGTSFTHDSAKLHVSGQARYVDDIPCPSNTLHLAFGLSTVAKGQIDHMDLSGVLSSKGVVRVITVQDLPHENDSSPAAMDEPFLADGTVHYIGQPIFLVVAQSHVLARRAVQNALISYREDIPILTIEDALSGDSYFEEGPRTYEKGALMGHFPLGHRNIFTSKAKQHLRFRQTIWKWCCTVRRNIQAKCSTKLPTRWALVCMR